MAKIKRTVKEPPVEYKVGDSVSFPFGSGWVSGKIVEDRGCLGIGGARLYGIKFDLNGEEAYVEASAVELTAGAVPAPPTATNGRRHPPRENGVPGQPPPRTLSQLLELTRKLPAAERGALLARLGGKLADTHQFYLLAQVLAMLPPQAIRTLEAELTARLAVSSH